MFGRKKRTRSSPAKVKTKEITKLKSKELLQKGISLNIDGEHYVTLRFGNAQHQGARDYQEDSFGYSDITSGEQVSNKGILAVLADGMGGLTNGKAVSDYVVSSAKSMFEKLDYQSKFPSQLINIITQVNEKICSEFSDSGKSGAGSTVVIVFVYKTKLYWASVGDSRLYLYRAGQLFQINEDHDYLNKLLGDAIYGNLSLKQAFSDPQKDALNSYIGHESLPAIDHCERGMSLQKKDVLLLCSDGVYNGMSDSEIVDLLDYDPQVAAGKIVKSVLSKKVNGQDNLTAMVINYD